VVPAEVLAVVPAEASVACSVDSLVERAKAALEVTSEAVLAVVLAAA
jgi:hypothetical protein